MSLTPNERAVVLSGHGVLLSVSISSAGAPRGVAAVKTEAVVKVLKEMRGLRPLTFMNAAEFVATPAPASAALACDVDDGAVIPADGLVLGLRSRGRREDDARSRSRGASRDGQRVDWSGLADASASRGARRERRANGNVPRETRAEARSVARCGRARPGPHGAVARVHVPQRATP
jgi:hypothetical protein